MDYRILTNELDGDDEYFNSGYPTEYFKGATENFNSVYPEYPEYFKGATENFNSVYPEYFNGDPEYFPNQHPYDTFPNMPPQMMGGIGSTGVMDRVVEGFGDGGFLASSSFIVVIVIILLMLVGGAIYWFVARPQMKASAKLGSSGMATQYMPAQYMPTVQLPSML